MLDWISQPWPWYVAGPLIGLVVPALLLAGNRPFGVSSNLRHLCAALLPRKPEFLRHDWRTAGAWNLAMAAGITGGGAIASFLLRNTEPLALAAATRLDLAALGIAAPGAGLLPEQVFAVDALGTVRGLLVIVGGGFLVGFGSSYAGGCTSGHAITGLASAELPSLIAVMGFFAGGLAATHLLWPVLS